MINQKNKTILSVVALVFVIAAIGYYAWLQTFGGGSALPTDFKVTADLSEEQIAKYRQEFNTAKDALAQNPKDFDALLKLGMVKKYIGDYRGAEEAWTTAGEQQLKNSTSFGNLADLYANFLQENDKADVAYQTAIRNSTGESLNVGYYRNYYYFVKDSLKDSAKAEQVLLQSIKDNPKNSELHILLAQLYRDSGNKSKALQYFQKALALDPTDDLVKQEIQKLQ